MKFDGTAAIPQPLGQAFERLLDPIVLKQCIPGCESVRAVAEDLFDVLVQGGIGPARGAFKGTIVVTELDPPHGCCLEIEAKSEVGRLEGKTTLRLEAGQDEDWTLVRYDTEAMVSGVVAGAGSAVVREAARDLTREFFARLAAES